MVSQNKMSEWNKRLENLKQETLVRYLEYINLDNDMDLYDVMLRGIVKGDLIHQFDSYSFNDLTKEEIEELKNQFQKNASLCFYDGDINYWLDSIEGVSLQDLDLTVLKLFSHFDYLMEIIKDGGKNAIQLLNSFQNSNIFHGDSVIDTLRNTFSDDESLKKCILEVSKDESLYKGLSDEEKAILFTYPNHVLYEKVDDDIYVTDPFLLKKKICEYLGDDELSKNPDLVSLVNTLGEEEFENTITNMYLDSMKESHYIHR